MIVFMYSAIIIAIPIFIFLLNLQIRNLAKKKLDYKLFVKKLYGFLFMNLIIVLILFVFIVYGFPYLMWNFGAKGYQIEDKVVNITSIKPISEGSKIYVEEDNSSGGLKYKVNIGGNIQEFDSKSTEIEQDNINSGDPNIEDVDEYNVYELLGNGIISSNVNNMYANVYIDNCKEIFLKKKKIICVPANSMQ